MDAKSRWERWQVASTVAILFALITLALSLCVLLALPTIIERNVRQNSNLAEDSRMLKKWINPKYTIKTRIWTYSVKNPDSVINGSRPIVKKTGPYVFDQTHHREILSHSNGTVKYKMFQRFHFNENDSCAECFLGNRVWIPNLIFQKFVDAASKPATKAATAALVVQTPFLEVEVGELLFDGYVDPFLDQVCAIPFVGFICESILDLPDRIGLFHGKNNSSPGVFEINDGTEDGGESIGKIKSFNGEQQTPEQWWSTTESRMINGTEGSLYRPFIAKDDKIEVFASDLCRSLDLKFKEEVDYGMLTANRYVLSKENFDYTLPKNAGFCNDNGKTYFAEQKSSECLPNGLLDVSRCQRGEPPIIVTMPNFLYAPDYVRDSVEGMDKPDPQRDEIQVDLEPRLGAVITAKRRFQINVGMWKGVELSLPGLDLEHFHSSVVPVIGIEEYAEIDNETLALIEKDLIRTESSVRFATVCGIAFSLVLLLVSLSFAIYKAGSAGEYGRNLIGNSKRKIAPTMSLQSSEC